MTTTVQAGATTAPAAGPSPVTTSTKPGLSVRLRVDWLAAILRVDQIQHDTLTALVATWGETGARDDVINQLDALADAVRSPREGELDALMEAVEGAAAMDAAEVEIELQDALRLQAELDAAIGVLARFNPGKGGVAA